MTTTRDTDAAQDTSAPGGVPQPRAPASHPWREVLALVRPGQWSKNLLVLAAPAAAGVLTHPSVLARCLVAGLAFVAASAAVYAFNDVRDAEDDRQHPDKRHRPVASGAITPRLALTLSALGAALSLILAALMNAVTLALVASYLLLSLAYTLRLKRLPVLDIVVVASGFVLRALAGAAATRLQVSDWFLLVSLFGALFIVSSKRRAETNRIGARTRAVLADYPAEWLTQVLTLSLSGTVLSYAAWAFQVSTVDTMRPALALSVLPALVVLLRYSLLVSQGRGERPERLLVRDRLVVATGLAWGVLVAWGLYLA